MVICRDEVLKLIEQNQATLRRLGVRRLGLFGSYARGEAMPGSDLDFVVELSEKSFDAYMDTKIFLEDLFQSRIDLVTMSSIKPRLLPIIQRETVYAPGILESTWKTFWRPLGRLLYGEPIQSRVSRR